MSDEHLRLLTQELRGSLEPALIESGESYVILNNSLRGARERDRGVARSARDGTRVLTLVGAAAHAQLST
ncbi:MAG: hypothetical protein ACRDXC_06515 [Acidimicrobiales bacterium]